MLYDVDLLRSAVAGLEVERAEQIDRHVGEDTAVDTLLLARRPTSP